MNIETKVNNILENNTPNYDDILTEDISDYLKKIATVPSVANAYLHKSLGVFGTIDNILKNAENNIKKMRATRKSELGDDPWIYALTQKIIRIIMGNPLLQICILSITAFGSYHLLIGIFALVSGFGKKIINLFKNSINGFNSLIKATPITTHSATEPSDMSNDINAYKEVIMNAQYQSMTQFAKMYQKAIKIKINHTDELLQKGMINKLNDLMKWDTVQDAPVAKIKVPFSIKYDNNELISIDGISIVGYSYFSERFQKKLKRALGGNIRQGVIKLAQRYGPHGLPLEHVASSEKRNKQRAFSNLIGKVFSFDEPIKVFDSPKKFANAPKNHWKNGNTVITAGTRFKVVDSSSGRWIAIRLLDTDEFAYQTHNFVAENPDLFGIDYNYKPRRVDK